MLRTLGASRMTWKPENCRQNVYLCVDCTQCADWKWFPKCKQLKLNGTGQEKLLRVRVCVCVRACVCVCVRMCVGVCVWRRIGSHLWRLSCDSKEDGGMEMGQSGEQNQSVHLQSTMCIFLFVLSFYFFSLFLFVYLWKIAWQHKNTT